jgi:anthranilate phosphoribosyltransferase
MQLAETISELVNSELTPAAAIECLQRVSTVPVNAETLRQAVSIVSGSASPEAIEAVREIDGAIDCCGTGGSGRPHYNISTTVAFVLAAGGLRVAKFGNRAASGRSGSFDFLEALGIADVVATADYVKIMTETNLVFLFSQQFFPTLKKLAPIRQALGKRTVFNFIGPLLNPTNPRYRLLGVPNRREQEAVAQYLAGCDQAQKAFVVTSHSGLDELDPAEPSTVKAVDGRLIKDMLVEPLEKVEKERAAVLDVKTNLAIFDSIVNNRKGEYLYYRAQVCLNAGAGFYVTGKSTSIEEGFALAEQLLSEGTVLKKYTEYRRIYERHAR